MNLFYGVMVAAAFPGSDRSGGKRVFVELYRRVTAADPAVLHRVAIVASTLACVALAVVFTRAVARMAVASPGPTERDGAVPTSTMGAAAARSLALTPR